MRTNFWFTDQWAANIVNVIPVIFLLSVNDPKPLNSFCPVRLTTDAAINDMNIIIISGHGWKDHFEKLISRNIFLCRSWHHSLAITRVSSVTHESS